MRPAVLAAAVLTLSCGNSVQKSSDNKYNNPQDFHSYANAREIRVSQVALDLEVLFDRRVLRGTATLALERISGNTIVLDTRDLKILGAEASSNSVDFQPTEYSLGNPDKIVGAPLRVTVPK